MKKLLVTRTSEVLQPLRALIEEQKHRTLVLWAIDCGARVLPIFENAYPHDVRPRAALDAALDWAHGDIKMPVARRAAIGAHNAASAVADNRAACAAARTMGHVVGTVHVETHAIGVPSYGLTAFAYAAPARPAADVIAEELQWQYDRLLYWQAHIDSLDGLWAPFLLRDDLPNKEKLMRLKMEQKQAGAAPRPKPKPW